MHVQYALRTTFCGSLALIQMSTVLITRQRWAERIHINLHELDLSRICADVPFNTCNHNGVLCLFVCLF